jgi:hypothetical protein
MSEYLLRSVFDLVLLTMGAVALVALLRLATFFLRVIPAPMRVRESMQRFAPVFGLTVLIAYVASGVAVLLAREPEFAAVLVSLVVVLVMFAWAPLYDLIGGVAFRFSRLCREGDHVRVGEIDGRVLEIGMRSLVVQTRQGDEAVLPYGKINRQTLRRTQSVIGAHVHAFVIDQSPDDDFASLKRHIIRSASRCHWASVVHEPKVERRDDNKVEVSVYALDADHAPEVETAVRKALAEGIPKPRPRQDTTRLAIPIPVPMPPPPPPKPKPI